MLDIHRGKACLGYSLPGFPVGVAAVGCQCPQGLDDILVSTQAGARQGGDVFDEGEFAARLEYAQDFLQAVGRAGH